VPFYGMSGGNSSTRRRLLNVPSLMVAFERVTM
jgi:hypothetical protein